MWVELASRIPLGDVDLREVADPSNLDVVGGLDEVRPGDGAVRNQPRTVPRLDAPRDLDALRVPDGGGGAGGGRREDAPVVDCVYYIYIYIYDSSLDRV